MGLRRLETPSPNGPVASGLLPVGTVLGEWQNVHSFLTECAWPDGKSRVTGTVMIFVEAGVWKAWCHDRDASMGSFTSADSLESLLCKLNAGFEDGQLDWRPDRARKK